MGGLRFPVLFGAALGLLTLQASAQHEHHMQHAPADSLAWRMPPMDMSMPMLPGLERALPPTQPFLAGHMTDPAGLPAARPARLAALSDGDTLHLEASLVRRQIHGRTLVAYGYNGQYPGPLIRVDKGATIVVRFTNAIEMPTTVHWHGLRLDNRFDGIAGITQEAVGIGETFYYEVFFPDPGLYWYHPHMREDIQQDLGLYGNMLVDPLQEDYYSPVHREEFLLLDDLLMDSHGLIPWGSEAPTHALMGRFGNVMLTNGVPDYRLGANLGEVIRFHLTNAANARTFNVTFGGARVKLIASDLSRFEREAFVESVPIAPAERYVAEVRFDEPGQYAITNSIQAINHFRGEFYPHIDTLALVTVTDEPAQPDLSEQFARLRSNVEVQADVAAFREHFGRPPDKELVFSVRVQNLPVPIMMAMEIDTLYVPPMEWNDAMPMMNWLSTGAQVEWLLVEPSSGKENMDVQWHFGQGDVIKVRLFNDPTSFHPMNHPFHVHGQRFLVLSLDGIPNTNMVWKDTAIVPVGSTMDILIDMDNPGDWMAHCHISEHLHSGMMLGFSVIGD